MSHTLIAPLANSNMQVWYNRLVDLCNIMSTEVLTVNSSPQGMSTAGNGFNTGTFGSTVLVASTIQGGTVNAVANLSVNSNMLFTGGNALYVGANVTVNSSSVFVGNTTQSSFINATAISIGGSVLTASIISSLTSGSNINANTSGLTSQLIDSFLKSAGRAANYQLQVTDNAANAYQISTVSMIFDGTNVLVTEYGQLVTNTILGVFNATSNATSIILQFTPTVSNTTVKGYKSVIAV
jgi:hypothetical protein